jgi:hypothetical protein
LFQNTTKKGRGQVGIDAKTREIIEQWKAICPDSRPEALIFPSGAGIPVRQSKLAAKKFATDRSQACDRNSLDIPGYA